MTLTIVPVTGLPEIRPGNDLPRLLAAATGALLPSDVLVVAQKIVSKAENRFVALSSISPGEEAKALAAKVNKDPRLVELVLRESSAVVRAASNVLITRHRLGHVMANAGIDASNLGPDNTGQVLLLPQNPDASAARISAAFNHRPAVIISDSFGRPWRVGTTNVAIGVHGVAAVDDRRGGVDRDGRTLQVTQIAVADALAAAAGLAMGETDEGIPAVLIRGFSCTAPAQTAVALIRSEAEDLFR